MTLDDWATVSQVPIFRAMGEELTRSLVRNRTPRLYDRGEVIFRQDDPADSFFLVLAGWVKLYRELVRGQDVVVAMFTAGETFAEAVMFRGGRYPATAEAVSPARVLRLDGTVLRRTITENPQIAFDMLAATSMHLKRLVEQIEQLKAHSAPERIAGFLLAQTPVRKGRVEIALPYEKSLIANRLGMTAESFSRALMKLRALDVTVERASVVIADIGRLADFVDGDPDMPGRQPACAEPPQTARVHARN
jgi:CRP-like cAMP-binding protein